MGNPEELVCGGCSDVSQAQMCPKHGTDYLEYKCRYCCSVAVFFCFGTTHFCNACHDDFQRVANIPKAELPQCPVAPKAVPMDLEECPLHVKHPATGVEYAETPILSRGCESQLSYSSAVFCDLNFIIVYCNNMKARRIPYALLC